MTCTAIALQPDSGEPGPTDAELIEAYRAGDTGQFETLYLRHHHSILAMLCAMTRDRNRAEELEQQAWYKAMLNLDKFDTGRDFRTWLRAVARNELCSDWRRGKRSNTCSFTEAGERQLEAVSCDGPVARHETTALRDGVSAAVRHLPVRERWAVEEHLSEGRPVAALARERGFKPGTVRCWVTRGVARVRRELESQDLCSTRPRPAYMQ